VSGDGLQEWVTLGEGGVDLTGLRKWWLVRLTSIPWSEQI